jgi:hypothetical protein
MRADTLRENVRRKEYAAQHRRFHSDYRDQDFVKEIHRLTSEGVDVVLTPSVVLTLGVPARLSALAGSSWPMAIPPRYLS